MSRRTLVVSRRTMLRLGVVSAWSLATLTVTSRPHRASAAHGRVAVADDDAEVTRFRFDPITPLPDFAPLGRLEEVWASQKYVTITDCVVTYVGEEPFELTPQEAAIVEVAEATGAVVGDPRQMYLLILAASTRIDPAVFDAKLAELGRPVVAASLALAPEAPQAALFAAWLQETA